MTAFDVIEHVADPAGFLAGVSALLEPGGTLFASTPDVESRVAQAFGSRWHFYYPYHLSYLGPTTIARAAPAALTMVDVSHRGRLRSVAYMIRYAAEMIGGMRPPRFARWFDGWYWSINLFDTMYVVFRRER